MTQRIRFDELLEAVEDVPDEAQAELVDVIRRRLAERGRERVVEEARQARKEFAERKCSTANPDDVLREIES
jgi:ribose 1,5-bisphosphokinase PhnN